jgi:branched-chain amino acid transport system ATP-binding protein
MSEQFSGLQIDQVSAGYGKALVIEKFSLSVTSGSVVAVVGPNGAGKSTLVRTISGSIRARSGEIRYNGQKISGLAPYRVARKGILHVPETRDIFSGMTVWENLMIAFDNLNVESERHEAFNEIYDLFPILAERKQDIAGNLSGGQQQMLAIARALLGRPKLLMLDEPSLGLASLIIKEIYSTLAKLREKGLTVLLVEQNAKMAINFADHSVVLSNGKIVLQGSRDELTSNEALAHHYLGARTDSR